MHDQILHPYSLITQLLQSPSQQKHLIQHAAQFVKQYDWHAIAPPNMIYLIPILAILILIYRSLKKRHQRNFQLENEARARLGLPPLTAAQYQLNPVEKSADYRHNINQHM